MGEVWKAHDDNLDRDVAIKMLLRGTLGHATRRERFRREVPAAEQRRLLGAFVAAASTGDLRALERLLADDVVSYSDGGGVVRASRIPVVGRTTVARFVRAFQPRFWEGLEVTTTEINARPAVVLTRNGAVFAVLSLVTAPDGIRSLLWMMNPHKLGAVASHVA